MSIIYPPVDGLINNQSNPNNIPELEVSAPLVYNGSTGQLAMTGASTTTYGYIDTNSQSIAGVKTFTDGINLGVSSQTVNAISTDTNFSSANDNTLPTQLAIKTYIQNSIAYSISWQEPIINFFDPTPGLPVGPIDGDRYISSATANGWIINYVYTYTTIWSGLAPQIGWTIYDSTTGITYNYNGTIWVDIGLALSQFNNINITSTVDSSSISTGVLICNGGAGISGNIYSGGNICTNNLNTNGGSKIAVNSQMGVLDTTDSISLLTGSLITKGGCAITKTLFVGGTEKILNTTISTSTSTGSLIVSGGIASSNNYSQQFTALASPTTQLSFQDSLFTGYMDTPTFIQTNIQNTNSGGFTFVAATNDLSSDTNNGYVSMSINGSNAVGSLVSAFGGASDSSLLCCEDTNGNGGNLYIGPWNDKTTFMMNGTVNSASFNSGGLQVLTSIVSTSPSTGSLIVSGGTGITGDVNISGSLTVNGSNNISYHTIGSTNWFLLNTLSTSQNLNIIARNSSNNMTQLLINAGTYSTNLENYSIGNMPRFLVYNTSGTLTVFIQSPVADTTVNALLNDVILTYSDFGSGTYPTGYTNNYVFDTSINAGFSTSDVFYLYNSTPSVSTSTGSLIINGGIGCANGLYVGGGSTGGITTTNGTGGYSQMFTDSNGNLNLASSNTGMIITSSNLQMKYQRQDDLNVNKLNNAPIYCYGSISSLSKIGCVEGLWMNPYIIGTTTSSDTCYGGLAVNNNTNQMELSTHNGGLNIRNVPNYTFFLSGNSYSNPDYTNNNISSGSVAITSGSLSIVGSQILMGTDGLSGASIKYSTGNSVDGGQVGSMSCWFTTNSNYTNPPTNVVNILQLWGSSTNGANQITLYHNIGGGLKLLCKDSTGTTTICDTYLGSFSPVNGTPYFLSVDWDFTAGNTQVFMNGVQYGATITSTGTRTFSVNIISTCPTNASYSLSFVQMYMTKQYTTTYTPPSITNYNLIKFPSTGGMTLYSDTTNQVSGLLTCASDGSLYWNSSALPGQFFPSQIIQITNTTQSTSTSTGALQVSGGAGIKGNLYVNSVDILATTVSSGTSTGSLIVSGGIGCGGIGSFTGLNIYNTSGGAVDSLVNDGSGNLDINVATGMNISTVSTYQWYASLSSHLNADYSANNSSLVATTSGSVSINVGKLLMASSSSSCYWATGGNGVDGASQGTINLKFTPLYTGSPTASVEIIQFTNSSGNTNRLQVYHFTSGHIKVTIYDNNTNIITNTDLGAWVQTNGTEYEFEINWNGTTNTARLFINGTQFGSNMTGSTYPFSGRTGTCAQFNISNAGGGSCEWRQIQIYTTTQHTSNYTPVLVSGSIALFSSAGVIISNELLVDGNFTVVANTIVESIQVYATSNATNTLTGALVVSGGMSIASDLYIGGTVHGGGVVTGSSTTFSTALIGLWTGSPLTAATVNLNKNGNVVTLTYPTSSNASVTNSANTFTFTNAIPSGYYNPNYAINSIIGVLNNNTQALAIIQISTSGVMTVVTADGNLFSGISGTGIGGFTLNYNVNI